MTDRSEIDYETRWEILRRLIQAEKRNGFRNIFMNRAQGLNDVEQMMLAIANGEYAARINKAERPAGSELDEVLQKIQDQCSDEINRFVGDLDNPERMGTTKCAYRIRDYVGAIRRGKGEL